MNLKLNENNSVEISRYNNCGCYVERIGQGSRFYPCKKHEDRFFEVIRSQETEKQNDKIRLLDVQKITFNNKDYYNEDDVSHYQFLISCGDKMVKVEVLRKDFSKPFCVLNDLIRKINYALFLLEKQVKNC